MPCSGFDLVIAAGLGLIPGLLIGVAVYLRKSAPEGADPSEPAAYQKGRQPAHAHEWRTTVQSDPYWHCAVSFEGKPCNKRGPRVNGR